MWIGTQGAGLIKFNLESGNIYTYSTVDIGLPSNNIIDLVIDKNNNKWLSTDYGITRFNGRIWQTFNLRKLGFSHEFTCMVVDNNNTLWVGAKDDIVKDIDGGLAKFDGTNWTIYNTKNSGLSSSFVYSIAIDVKGHLWVANSFRYLTKFDGYSWKNFDLANYGLERGQISLVVIDKMNKGYIGGLKNEVNKVNFGGMDWIIHEGLISASFDKDNNIWLLVGAENSSTKLFKYIFNSSAIEELTLEGATAIALDREGNIWYGAGWGTGNLTRFDLENYEIYNYKNSKFPNLINGKINCLEFDKEGTLWIGTSTQGVVSVK